MELEIVTWPAKVLETRASEVTVFDEALAQFCEAMHRTLDKGGIAVAANQVGSLQRIVVVHIPFQEGEDEKREWYHDQRMTLINPQITAKSGKISLMEGCLSFPDVWDYVPRARKVTVQAQDVTGKPIEFFATDLLAVCMQHEIDHLDGIVFLNRMSRLKAALHRKKLNMLASKKQVSTIAQ